MADKGNESDFILENDDDGSQANDIEVNKTDSGGSASSGEDDEFPNDDDDAFLHTFSSQVWPQSYR